MCGPWADYRVTPATALKLRKEIIGLVASAGPRRKREFCRRFIAKRKHTTSG